METIKQINNQFSNINNYTYLDRIGEGGYGLVFKAEQLSTSQVVAIKTIKFKEGISEQKKNQQLARFERETKLCAEINHPNIVQLLDKGYSDNGEPYAVFEYIEGETLKEFILQNNGLPAPEMAVLMGQVLDALVCAHAKGIVHRDLKPHNIMVSKLGSKYHAKILDFGIGAFTHDFRSIDYQSLTVTQDILGTPTYSAPEQLRGEAPTVKSDLYAWGLIVIECLTGKPVMDGGSIAEVFQQQLMPSNVPIPPAIVGHDLANLLRRVLEKNPRNRAGNVESISREFEKINFNTLTGDIAIQRKAVNSFEESTVGNDMVWSSISGSRKQLTILCLKLNLEIADDVHLDLEILDAIQKDQLNLCKDTAIRYGGNVSGAFMNNLSVYFGYPESNDTDARRAGRTALELVTEIKKRSTLMFAQHGVALSIQIGLHTGTVLVQRNRTPEGNVPNTAFDLVYKATPGSVLVSASSKKLLDQFLEFEKVELTDDSNAKAILETFQLVGERQTEALSSLRPWSATREMIGRDNEKNEVLKLWKLASYKGNGIIINGQAGIGKSKLTYEVKKEIRSVGGMVRECRCLPEHRNNALYPFFNMLRNHWGIIEVEDKNLVIEKLKSILEFAGCKEVGSLSLLCSWLSISLPEEYVITQGTPEEQKKLLFHILKQCILQIDREKSFLLVIEDLHWLDPTSTEFIQYLLSELEVNQYLLVMTTRPVFDNLWKYDYLSQINLETLSKKALQLLVEGVLGGETISDKTLNYIEQRADGIPLFIEELTSMLLEYNYIQLTNNVYELAEFNDDLVPMTLQDLLNARLDRLSLAKETAQLAATIGREFSYELLVQSSAKDEATVQNDLNLLMNSDLIYRQRRVQGEKYIFRHALIRDAAYEGMVVNQRKEFHGLIVSSIESLGKNNTENNYSVLAMHCSQAQFFDKAVNYGSKAATLALKRSVAIEAIEEAKKVLSWIAFIEDKKQIPIKLEVYGLLTSAYMETKGWASEEVRNYTNNSIKLLQTDPETYKHELIPRLWWKMFSGLVSGARTELPEIEKQLEPLISIANPVDKANIFGCLAYYRYTGGFSGYYVDQNGKKSLDKKSSVEVGKYYAEQSASYTTKSEDRNDLQVYGWDYQAFAWSLLGRIYWDIGEHDQARIYAKKGVDKATSLEHAPSMCICLMYASIVHQYDNNKSDCLKTASELIKVSEENELLIYASYGGPIYAWASNDLDQEAFYVNNLMESGSLHAVAYFASLSADIYIERGDMNEAIATLDKCIALCHQVDEHYYEAQLHHRRAVCRLNALPENNNLTKQDREQIELVKQDLKIAKEIANSTGAIDTSYQISLTFNKAREDKYIN
ncbi:MAG: TOMM system kinase/cyclase fusion protein [Kordia sp.]|nr:MAG: TOMM system kinase/cyclase fusion protein [Kordia sp.]